FEAESLDEALKVVRAAHEAVFKAGVGRVITTIRIDDRRDLKRSMEEKVESLLGLI
ncbi:thiamine-binding protein, partial [Candidatus Bathyarchaeota archaeon]